MASLGQCKACGGALAAVGATIACGQCETPARDHPLAREMASARLAEAKRKLIEIDGQLKTLNTQRQHWANIEAEEQAKFGSDTVPAAPKPRPQLPSMIPPGMKPGEFEFVAADKISVTEKPYAFTHGERLPEPAVAVAVPAKEAWERPDDTVPVHPKPGKRK